MINVSYSTNVNFPLKRGHTYNQDTFLLLKGVHIIGVPLYRCNTSALFCSCVASKKRCSKTINLLFSKRHHLPHTEDMTSLEQTWSGLHTCSVTYRPQPTQHCKESLKCTVYTCTKTVADYKQLHTLDLQWVCKLLPTTYK